MGFYFTEVKGIVYQVHVAYTRERGYQVFYALEVTEPERIAKFYAHDEDY